MYACIYACEQLYDYVVAKYCDYNFEVDPQIIVCVDNKCYSGAFFRHMTIFKESNFLV